MIAWLIYYRDSAQYNQQYINLYVEEGAKLGITVRLILVEDLEFGVRNNHWFITYQNREVPKPDFAICRAIYPLLSRQLELMGIRVFNRASVSEICNDKARTYQYLAKTGIPMVDTSFYQNGMIEEQIKKVKKPMVVKAVEGHGGRQVFLTEPMKTSDVSINGKGPKEDTGLSGSDYRAILAGLGGSDVVMQPLIGSRHQDLRVYVIGREIIAAVLRTAVKGFKSNFTLGGEVSLYSLSKEETILVNRITEEFDFDFVGIDFIVGDRGELIFNEIEDVVGARMLYRCSDIPIVSKYLNYILKQF